MVSIIKLVNGTELIGNVLEENRQTVVIDNPLQIVYTVKTPSSPPMIALQRYIPFSNKTIMSFKQEHVINKVDPLQNMVGYYNATLKGIQEHIDTAIDQELLAACEESSLSPEGQAKLAMIEKHITKATLN